MFRRLLCGLLILVVSSPAFSQGRLPKATEIAAKITAASSKANYAAVRRLILPSQDGTKREVDERVMRSRGRVYISYFKDSPYADTKIFERDGKRYTYTISTNEIRISPSRTLDEITRLLTDPKGDDPIIKYGEKIAGRSTYLVESRFGRDRGMHRMWVDTQQFVILKRNFLDAKGDVQGGYEVIEINFNAKISDSKFSLPKGAKLVTVEDDLKRLAKQMGVDPFMITNNSYTLMNSGQMEFDGVKILRQFYTSNDKRVSLFVMKGSQKTDGFRQSDRVKIFRWEDDGHTLVLVGDLSQDELERLAKSVKA
ncbi:MAG: hypothetical protein KF824_05505 [Fimbriimonadaceae bacterium]|nr:MAG: hypothetical protein KF824_05505 [Fimbriimonadaceae bacterium]